MLAANIAIAFEATQPRPNVNDVTFQTTQTTLAPIVQTAPISTAKTAHVPIAAHDSGITLSAPDYILCVPVLTAEYDVLEVVIYATHKPIELL